ncbi:MAG: hypothetical protein IKL21_00205 [Clostridia bacterium]|nr:hypothetical protein [Clostridia bacterium]
MIKKIKGFLLMLYDALNVNCNEWIIAIRKTGKEKLYDGNNSEFHLIKNSIRYWRADPFLFKHNGKNYLFAEMFDRKKKKGVIGVACVHNGKVGKFKVALEENFHLSYPCIFEHKKSIYMIPESSDSQELWLYTCDKFPYKWKKIKKISNDCVADATPFFVDNTYTLLATKFNNPNNRQNDNLSIINKDTHFNIIMNNLLARPAGHIIKLENNKLIRPSQNNTHTYGGNLVFNEIQQYDKETFLEHPFLQIYSDKTFADENDIIIQCSKKHYWNYKGIHTYNLNEDYEVIDLKYSGGKSIYSLLSFLKRKYLHI